MYLRHRLVQIMHFADPAHKEYVFINQKIIMFETDYIYIFFQLQNYFLFCRLFIWESKKSNIYNTAQEVLKYAIFEDFENKTRRNVFVDG